MINVLENSLALQLLEEIRSEAGSKDKFMNNAVDSIINATQESLDGEVNINPDDILEMFDQEPLSTLFKDLLKIIVLREKLELEYKFLSKRKELLVNQIRLEVEERYDIDDVRISHSLGAVIRLTEEDKKQADKKAMEARHLVVNTVKFLISSKKETVDAFSQGKDPEGFEKLRENSELEPFVDDMIEFLMSDWDAGCSLIRDILNDEDVCNSVLESKKTPKPIEYFSHMVKLLRKADELTNE